MWQFNDETDLQISWVLCQPVDKTWKYISAQDKTISRQVLSVVIVFKNKKREYWNNLIFPLSINTLILYF